MVPRSSAVAFRFGSKDPFFRIANKKLAWLSSDVCSIYRNHGLGWWLGTSVTRGFVMISKKGFERGGIS